MADQTTPYGAWPSPISAASLVGGTPAVGEVCADGADLWWSEQRPSESGRTALVKRSANGSLAEPLGADVNVRTRVHEYGGGAWYVQDGVLFYVEFADQRLRKLEPGTEPLLLTAEPEVPGGDRYADGRLSPDGSWFVCIRERHSADGAEPTNEIVAVATDGSGDVRALVSGPDFVAAPRFSPDGQSLAWLQWDHPHMPWDGTELWLATWTGDAVAGAERVAGGDSEWIFQPVWHPDGRLCFVSDANGWSTINAVDAAGDVEALRRFDAAEVAVPQWVFGQSRYGFVGDTLAWAATSEGRDGLQIGDSVYSGPHTEFGNLAPFDGGLVSVAGSHLREPDIIHIIAADERLDTVVIRRGRDLGIDDGFLEPPRAITFPTSGGATARALFYGPANPDATPPADELPPLLVLAHGGPTAAARRQLQPALRYWTSRGFAVVDVDYRGSTGHGREYRRALNGQWGLADVDDCVAATEWLVGQGLVDGDRLAIRGGSAGGFTVLSALAFHDNFAVGASRYGVADLAILAQDTHKFESRYLDTMVGPYPEAQHEYRARSPLFHAAGISCPVILLQGLDDKVVPPNQAEAMLEPLAAKGIRHEYLPLEGEGHGFRKAESIVAALQAELDFFGEVLGFRPASDLPES